MLLLGQAVQQPAAGSLAIVMVREGCLGAVGRGHSHRANAIATITTEDDGFYPPPRRIAHTHLPGSWSILTARWWIANRCGGKHRTRSWPRGELWSTDPTHCQRGRSNASRATWPSASALRHGRRNRTTVACGRGDQDRWQRPRWQRSGDFLRACRRAAIPTGLVTAAWRSLVDASLERMRVDIGTEPFDVVVTGDSVTTGKPHAEPYETAARAIGVATCDCLAVEDSPTGVQSALAAGCVVVAVPQGVRVEGSSALIVDTLENRQPQDLWRDARRLRLDA